MKEKHIVLLISIFLSLNTYSQNTFKDGYFINDNNQKINCLINTIDWHKNPTEFTYKLSEKEEPRKAKIQSINEFGVYGISKYIKAKVNIDRGRVTGLSNISETRSPKYEEEELFLEVLVEGKASLYQYLDVAGKYFYKIDNSNIEQLVFKSYKTIDDEIAENNRFRQQLLNDLNCPDFTIDMFKSLGYFEKDLMKIFRKYNNCLRSDLTYSKPEIKRNKFDLTIRPRFDASSLIMHSGSFHLGRIDAANFGRELGFGFGLEAELFLPMNKNKWSLILETTYQRFKSETIENGLSENQINLTPENMRGETILLLSSEGPISFKARYVAVEMPISLRYYFLLKNSKIFINVFRIYDLNSKFNIEAENAQFTRAYSRDFYTTQNFGFGIGYKVNGKYSAEMRYQKRLQKQKRSSGSTDVSSSYNTLSLIFGYTII